MRAKPRFRGCRINISALAIGYFVAATLALIWPAYTTLGNSIEPRVFGMPWSLVYVLLVIAANAAVLTVLYRTRALERPATRPEPSAGDGPRD